MAIILDLLHEDGIAPKRVASTHGGEYAGACPACGGRDRFRVWPEEGDGGKWWCRGCNTGGDLIQYLRDIRNMSYSEACNFLGQEPKQISRSLWFSSDGPKWTPRETVPPNHKWIARCSSLVDWAQEQLWSGKYKDHLAWLKSERGLSENTIKAYRLGWNPQTYWRDRSAWGLPEETKDNGKPKKLWLPEGLVIPYYAQNSLLRARIRLQSPWEGVTYCLVSGSSTEAMILGKNEKIFIVVESELDAILLNQKIGDLAGVIALGSAQARPDKLTTEILGRAELILIALDGDDPGAKEAWVWWPDHFDQAKRWPPIDGKDPGEMLGAEIDLKEWVEIGIEEYSQPAQIDQGHQVMETVFDPGDQVEPESTNDFEIVELYSDLVNEKFYVCRTPELRDLAKENDPGVVAYLPGEIESLEGLQPEEVKKLHHAKKLFGGNLSRSPRWETLKVGPGRLHPTRAIKRYNRAI